MNLIFYLICTFLEIFLLYKLVSKDGDPLLAGGYNLNRTGLNLSIAAMNAFTDLLILVLPQRTIWRLHLPPRKKLAISAVFLVGVL